MSYARPADASAAASEKSARPGGTAAGSDPRFGAFAEGVDASASRKPRGVTRGVSGGVHDRVTTPAAPGEARRGKETRRAPPAEDVDVSVASDARTRSARNANRDASEEGMAEARRKSRGVATGREGRRARRECRPRRRARPRHLACRGSTRRPAKNHRTRRQSSPRPRCASLRNENARRFVKNHITRDVDVPRRRRSATSPRARQRRRLARPGCSTRSAVSRGFTAPSEEKRAAKIGLASFATDRDAFPALRFHRAGRLRPARRPRHHRRSRPLSVRALLTAGAAYLSLSLPTTRFAASLIFSQSEFSNL